MAFYILGLRSEVNMRAFLVLALCLAAAAAAPQNPQRIVGGSITTVAEYPSIVAMLYTDDLEIYWQGCGASIINDRSFLSATHCYVGNPIDRWRLRAGSNFANSGGTVHTLERITMHPNYNEGATLNNDVCIIRTTLAVTMIPGAVQAGFFSGANYLVPDNSAVWAVGWGDVAFQGKPSEILRHVEVWIINLNTCINRYAAIGMIANENMICSGWLDVGGRDQCQGDSGGPLYHEGVIVGVCSWGYRCAEPYFPGVNARVSRFIDWIRLNA